MNGLSECQEPRLPSTMRIANAEHEALPWRINDVAADFALEDVWALPVTGKPDQFTEVLAMVERQNESGTGSGPTSWLMTVRMALGKVFGWDDEVNALPIPGCTETSVRDRLPEPERADLPPVTDAALPFRPVYRGADEAFTELSNGTVHALMQLTWVPDGETHRARMAVYVKPRGRKGRLYMAAIAPFRHLIVYPAMIRNLGRRWEQEQSR